MATRTRTWKLWFWSGGGVVLLICLALAIWPVLGMRAAAPGLLLTRSTNSLLLLSITNATPSDCFELYWRPGLESTFTWSLLATGAMGQSNWLIQPWPPLTAFFKAGIGHDWDGDGILNWQDADPNSTNVGYLSITIESPANGALLQ